MPDADRPFSALRPLPAQPDRGSFRPRAPNEAVGGIMSGGRPVANDDNVKWRVAMPFNNAPKTRACVAFGAWRPT